MNDFKFTFVNSDYGHRILATSDQWQSGKVAKWQCGQWQSGKVAKWHSGRVAKWHSGSAVDLRQQPETECHEQLKVNVLVPRPAANGAPLVVAGRCGTSVAQVWCKCGTGVAGGTGVAQVWHRCGTGVARCGASVAQVWQVAHVWHRCGTGVAPSVARCGASVAQVWQVQV
jgi:hypothetical protein